MRHRDPSLEHVGLLTTDNLIFSAWLDVGGYLVPVLLRHHPSAPERRRRVLALNDCQAAQDGR